MAVATAEMTKIGLRYAQALLDVSESAKATDKVAKDMAELGAAIAGQADLRDFINNPLLGAAQQDHIVQDIAKKAKLSAITLNFLRTLVSNGRLSVLPSAITAFHEEAQRRGGTTTVDVASAYPLTDTQQADLAKALATVAGGKVALKVTVDKTLLGGLTIRVGSNVIDDSVAGRLQRLRQTLVQSAAHPANAN